MRKKKLREYIKEVVRKGRKIVDEET